MTPSSLFAIFSDSFISPDNHPLRQDKPQKLDYRQQPEFNMLDTPELKFTPLLAEISRRDLNIRGLLSSVLQPFQQPTSPKLPSLSPTFRTTSETSTALPTPASETTTIHHGFSGFGRRNSLLLIYTAAVVLANRKFLQRQGSEGSRLHLHFSIYELQSENEGGLGNSFQTNCDGALNTGLPGKVQLPTVKLEEFMSDTDVPEDIKTLTDLTDLARGVAEGLDISKHKENLREENLAALGMFLEAVRKKPGTGSQRKGEEEEVNPGLAFTTRGEVGKIHGSMIQKALKWIEENMSDLITIERFFEHEVVGIDLSNPQKPKLQIRTVGGAGASGIVTREFDFVHLSNGTPWKSPVHDEPTPGLYVYSGIPNHDEVRKFLDKCGLLLNGEKTMIKPGSKIGITGLSLSAFDFIPLILKYTSIIEYNEKEGYIINESDAEKYAGLLTFVSNSGVPAPPRHANPNHFASPKAILTTEEVHAMLLQRQFSWIQFWKVFLDANVARALGKMPKDLEYRRSGHGSGSVDTKDIMISYARQTEAHLRGDLTEVGLLRSGYWLIYGGRGFEVNPSKAEQDLIKKAPLSRRERAGGLLRRAALSEVTNLEYVKAGNSNKGFFEEYHRMHSTISGSPPRIHYLVCRLFELGVATHVIGKFEDIAAGKSIADSTGPHAVQALFAPKSLDRGCDPVFNSLRGKVKEIVDGQPEYGKGRFLKSRTGGYVNAMDMGMGGHGTSVKVPSSCRSGESSMVGIRWHDTSTLEAAVSSAATVAPMTVLLSSISAQRGIKDPVGHLLKYYRSLLPSEEEFRKEMEQFSEVWREINEKHAFLLLCEEVATTGAEYLEYTEGVFDPESRERVVCDLIGSGKLRHAFAVRKYRDAVEGMRVFDPPSVEEFYFERFVDFSPTEVEGCWEKHRIATV
ncbi:hypothetical protein L218DRAFT_1073954 [Marasmius fiardii PR-910]|nr:hypothetical protein L218DRAFT_1073954 [Marasmius fiardii PR-910]